LAATSRASAARLAGLSMPAEATGASLSITVQQMAIAPSVSRTSIILACCGQSM